MITVKREADKIFFENFMNNLDKSYDEKASMTSYFMGENTPAHSKLKNKTVHDTRNSFEYAYHLLRRNNDGDVTRAHDVLYRVLQYQDINPNSKTYGIWPYYIEEPLYEMVAPDFNWADFNGKTILRILLHHESKLTNDIKMRLKDSVYHACMAIIKRNVGPDYTNISVMGSYVTIIAGEYFGWADIFAYGKERLKKLYEYNTNNGSFSEFNSPTYTFTALFDLSDFVLEAKDNESFNYANTLLDMIWETLALHYHPQTGQLAGPHYRAYSFLLDDNTKFTLEKGLNHQINLADSIENLIDKNFCYDFSHEIKCPEKFIPYFTEKLKERVMDQTFRPGTTAYTYFNNNFTVGSLSLLVSWNQHKNVLGYFGSIEKPIAFNLRFLHDNYDYCSALMGTVQDKNKVLTGVNFVTDFGDTHGVLDPVKNATISAESMVLQYVFKGAVDELKVEKISDKSFCIKHKECGVNLIIDFPYVIFDDFKTKSEFEKNGDELYFNLVLYKGERRDFNFALIKKAALIASLEISVGEINKTETEILEKDGRIKADFNNLSVDLPLIPGTFGDYCVNRATKLYRNGEIYEPLY